MTKIRHIEIQNFRAIKHLDWHPSEGINCLIGPGDSGKSTVLDAIDACLGARRNMQFSDADFFNLDVESPIKISLTLGDLDESLKNLDSFGLFLRGYESAFEEITDEPTADLEKVLTLQLQVTSDLEPSWTLYSERASEAGIVKSLAWAERVRLAPTRIGAFSEYNFTWRHGSILNRLSDETAETASAFVTAAREARKVFGGKANEQVRDALQIVKEASTELGIEAGREAQALLDAHTASFGSGTISLHDKKGVPLKGLGTGSARLLVAGLQKRATESSKLLLVDEVEYGLEPHRIIRLLDSLGAHDEKPVAQVFMTTHSPIVLRELSGKQLYVLRCKGSVHEVKYAGNSDEIQGALRRYPEAFLAIKVMICEGASEVGFVRGLDQYATSQKAPSFYAQGAFPIDCGGGGKNDVIKRAQAFLTLGYVVAALRDDDQPPDTAVEDDFKKRGGLVFHWQKNRALEEELFFSLPDKAVALMIQEAINIHGLELLNALVTSASGGKKNLTDIEANAELVGYDEEDRAILAKAACRQKNNPWFKTVGRMQAVVRNAVAPYLTKSEATFKATTKDIMAWMYGK